MIIKVTQLVARAVFNLEGVFKIAKRSYHVWATFVRKFVAENFEKSPNLVTLTVRLEARFRPKE